MHLHALAVAFAVAFVVDGQFPFDSSVDLKTLLCDSFPFAVAVNSYFAYRLTAAELLNYVLEMILRNT